MSPPSPLDQSTQEALSSQPSSAQTPRLTQWQRSIETLTVALSPLPVLTGCLLVIHCWIYGLMGWEQGNGFTFDSFSTQTLLQWGGNAYLYTLFDEPWRLIASGFVHVNVWHLVSNLIWIWFLGRELEHFIGKRSFAVLYIGSSVCAALSSLAWQESSHISVGASGTVYGLVGGLSTLTLLTRGGRSKHARKTLILSMGFMRVAPRAHEIDALRI